MPDLQRASGPTTTRIVFLAVVFSVLTLGAVVWNLQSRILGPVSFFGTTYDAAEPAPAFELVNHRGEVERLESHRGSVVLLFFGFTNCPDVCPLTLARLTDLVERIGARGEDIRILLVTVDPERDTPEVLAEYVASFGPSVTGLTGESSQLESIRRDYGVYAGPTLGHDGHTMVAHTDAVFGIDRSGLLRVLLRPDAPEHELDGDIRALLRS